MDPDSCIRDVATAIKLNEGIRLLILEKVARQARGHLTPLEAMRGSQLLYDGMWRCLCPAFDRNALRKAVVAPVLSRSSQRRPATRRVRCVARSNFGFRRTYVAAARTIDGTLAKEARTRKAEEGEPSKARHGEEQLLAPKPPSDQTLNNISVEYIVTCLRTIRHSRGLHHHEVEGSDRHRRILLLVEHLLKHRDQPPSPFIYECVMDAMVDPLGSAGGVKALLHEMTSRDIKATAMICQSALDALTLHPDYVLRQDVLRIMQDFWFTIDTPARQSTVIGMLRDEQYELAYARVTQMIEQGVVVDPWVYDIFITVFGQLGFLDEMLSLLQRRKEAHGTDQVMSSLLYYALDVCSQAFHYEGTTYAWKHVMRDSVTQPPDGIVESVMGTAARHGDAELATEALTLLASRSRVQPHQYEAVAETFARNEDMAGALRILCIMGKGMVLGHRNTRTILAVLKQKPQLIADAESAVRKLHGDYDIPFAGIAVVVEAKIIIEGSEGAIELYRDVQALCGEPPDGYMIQNMILHSENAQLRRELIQDYAEHVPESENHAQDGAALDVLIPTCLEAGQLGLAFRFAKKAVAQGQASQHSAWIRPLVHSALVNEDERIWEFVGLLDRNKDEALIGLLNRLLRECAARRSDRKAEKG